MRDLDAILGEDYSTDRNCVGFVGAEEQQQEDARSGGKWLCKAEMETRFGVRLTSAMLNSGQMKKMLCFAKHSMEKDMCLYRRPNIVDETIGST